MFYISSSRIVYTRAKNRSKQHSQQIYLKQIVLQSVTLHLR